MYKYSTGEIAKLCGVSVRTVQYYDSRNILVPSALSEGGRRLYTEEDLKRMRIICFLREMGFSLDHIAQLFSEEEPETVIHLLIEQQEQLLRKEVRESQSKLLLLSDMKKNLKKMESFSVDSLGDIAQVIKFRKKRRKMLFGLTVLGLFMDVVEILVFVYGVCTGNWWPVAVGLPFVLGGGLFISYYYFHHVDYICPACHRVFHPELRQAFWSSHTPNTRRLTCPDCGHKGFCVETYAETEKK